MQEESILKSRELVTTLIGNYKKYDNRKIDEQMYHNNKINNQVEYKYLWLLITIIVQLPI